MANYPKVNQYLLLPTQKFYLIMKSSKSQTGPNVIKPFYVRNLRIFVISKSVYMASLSSLA